MDYETYESITEIVRQNYYLIFPGILVVGAFVGNLVDSRRNKKMGKCVDRILNANRNL